MKAYQQALRVIRRCSLGSTIVGTALAAALTIGCGHTGFVGLSEPEAPASPAMQLPIYAARDIGRPYRVLGYVFRSTEGHKSGLAPMDEHMYVLSPGSEEMSEVRREALARGADAIVGLELFPTLNGFGQPVGFSVGGLAVKFTDQSAAVAPNQPTTEPAAVETATPDVGSKSAPLEEPEPAPEDPEAEGSPPELPAP